MSAPPSLRPWFSATKQWIDWMGVSRDIVVHTGADVAVIWTLYQTADVKREMSWRAKLSVYQSVYVPTFTYGHELIVSDRKNEIQVAKMSFLCRLAGVEPMFFVSKGASSDLY